MEEQPNKPPTNREMALKWWRDVGQIRQHWYCKQHFPNRLWTTLTGREVQSIWAKEIQNQ